MNRALSRTRYTPKNIPLILAAASAAWLVLGAGVYLFGVGFLTLLEIIGGAL
jgi:hypothetical protein